VKRRCQNCKGLFTPHPDDRWYLRDETDVPRICAPCRRGRRVADRQGKKANEMAEKP